MNEVIEAGQALENMSVTGILACAVIVLLLILWRVFQMREQCLKKLLKAVQGKEISE